MQTIILLSLLVLGANATFWHRREYPNSQWTGPHGRPFHWDHDRTLNHQQGFPQWYSQQQQNIDIERSLAEAEWVCRNPKTGDVLIVAPQTEDKKKEPINESTHISEQEHGQDTINQQNTMFPKEQTTENSKIRETSTHGGEGLIDIRFGE